MNPRIATAKATIELLVSAEKPHAGVANVDAWTTSVRNRIRAEHWDWIMDRLELDPNSTAEDLADAIAETKAEADPRPPTVRHYDDRKECRQCGGIGGGGWLDGRDRDDLGMTPDLEPCPSCAPDRRRMWERQHDPVQRTEYHASHAASVDYLRAHQPELRERAERETRP